MVKVNNPQLARLHGLVCGDGVLDKRRPRKIPRKSHRETSWDKVGWGYRIMFYSKEKTILYDFAKLFKKLFNKEVKLNFHRYEAVVHGKKYYLLLKSIGMAGSYTWKFPVNYFKINSLNEWVKAFFDCEATIANYDYNRRIVISSVNLNGLYCIQDHLSKLSIPSIVRGPYFTRKVYKIYYLIISKKENLVKFRNKIGFNHPKKRAKLDFVISSYS